METADSERFDVVFAADCLEGHEAGHVREALGRLFRADDATLDKLFSGAPQRIKTGVDKATALKYQQAMERAGARALLRPSDPGASATRPATQASRPAPGPELQVEPVGSDVLRPEERRSTTPDAPDTSHLSVAPSGERLGPRVPAVEAPVRAPDYELAAAGSDLGPTPEPGNPVPPDTSHLSVAEGPLDLSDCVPEPATPPPLDLGHLSVAEAGGDLLGAQERARPEVSLPDTSHLALTEPGASSSDSKEAP